MPNLDLKLRCRVRSHPVSLSKAFVSTLFLMAFWQDKSRVHVALFLVSTSVMSWEVSWRSWHVWCCGDGILRLLDILLLLNTLSLCKRWVIQHLKMAFEGSKLNSERLYSQIFPLRFTVWFPRESVVYSDSSVFC